MKARQQWVAFATILTREVRRFMRIWLQTLLPPAITIVLYFVIFGALIGPRIGVMAGHTYIDFVVPGLIMMSVITNSYSNVVSSFYGNKFQGSIEEILVSPVPNYVILLGFVFGGVARGIAVGAIVTLLSLLFTSLQLHHLAVILGMVLLTAILFSIAGLINAIFAESFDDISIIPTFVLTPLTYLGGVFYSIDMLPEFWQAVSRANPILYMVNAFRYGFLGTSDIPVSGAFLMVSAFIALSYVYAIHLLARGRRLRR